ASVAAATATDMRGASPAVTTSTATMTTATAAMTAAAAAMGNKLYHRGCSIGFFVEDVESSQANVLPRRGRPDCHFRCLKRAGLPAGPPGTRVLQGLQTRCPPATTTIQRPLAPGGLCSAAFSLNHDLNLT